MPTPKLHTLDQINAATTAALVEARSKIGNDVPVQSEAARFYADGPLHLTAERMQSGGLSDAPPGAPKATDQAGSPFRLR
jgi:hypothetical protein